MRKSNKNRRHIVSAVSLKAIVVALTIALSFGVLSVGVKESGATEIFLKEKRKIPVYSVKCDQKKVAISFDAAYGADKTERIMEILKEHEVEATFFLVGFWVDKYPETTKLIDQNGFEIGTHSNEHLHMSKLSREDIRIDLEASLSKIESITGKRPTVFRAPYGEYDNKLIEEAQNLELTTVQWDVDSLDWKGIDESKIVSRVVSGVKEGSIVLFHNNSDHIVEALPTVIELLKERGYTFCKVGDLLHKGEYTIDNNGMQIPIMEDKK